MVKKSRKWLWVSVILICLCLFGYCLFYTDELSSVLSPKPTRDDFEFLYLGMEIDKIAFVKRVGWYDGCSGYMCQWRLHDGSFLFMRFDYGEELAAVWLLHPDETREDFFTGKIIPQLSLSDFAFLNLGMEFEQVIKIAGEPYTEAGSGIHYITYQLEEGYLLTLTFNAEFDEKSQLWIDVVKNAHLYKDEETINFFTSLRK